MTVAEMPTNAHHPAAPALCRVRVWPLPAGLAHHAERIARAIIRSVLADSDVGREGVLEAEIIVAELAVNAVQHALPPYELRVVFAGQTDLVRPGRRPSMSGLHHQRTACTGTTRS